MSSYRKGKNLASSYSNEFSELISASLEPSLEVCAHCGCKVYEGAFGETSKGKELTFCCCHCAASYKQNQGI